MKERTMTAVWATILLFTALRGGCADTNFLQAIRYTPPAGYGGYFGLDGGAPSDNLFSGEGPGFMCSSRDHTSFIVFQLGLVGFYFSNGKIMKFHPVGAAELKQSLELTFKGKFPTMTPAVIGNMSGLTVADLTAQRPPGSPPTLLRACWVQVGSNAVLKVTAASSDPDAFRELTNSIGKLTIDKSKMEECVRLQLKAEGATNDSRHQGGAAQQ